MKHFAPVLLLTAITYAKQNDIDLLQNLILKNESRYLHLLGMDEESKMFEHVNSASNEIERVYRELAEVNDSDIPVYHITHE